LGQKVKGIKAPPVGFIVMFLWRRDVSIVIEPSRLAEITFFATSHSDIQYVYISKSTIFNVRPPETKGFWNLV